jgi:hypothetical protein
MLRRSAGFWHALLNKRGFAMIPPYGQATRTKTYSACRLSPLSQGGGRLTESAVARRMQPAYLWRGVKWLGGWGGSTRVTRVSPMTYASQKNVAFSP